MKLTGKEVAADMGISIQLLRSLCKQGKLPFAIVKENSKNNTYYFDRERFERWKKGDC